MEPRLSVFWVTVQGWAQLHPANCPGCWNACLPSFILSVFSWGFMWGSRCGCLGLSRELLGQLRWVKSLNRLISSEWNTIRSCSKLLCILRLSHFLRGGRATVVVGTEARTLKLFQHWGRERKTEPLPKHNKTQHRGNRNRFAAI